MTDRFAIYHAPAATSLLWIRAAQWLGRDPAAGEVVSDVPGLDAGLRHEVTRSARRYGFHATLKAPMPLAAGTSAGELEAAMQDFARSQGTVELGKLVLADLDGFLALVPARQPGELTSFAADCVTAFERFRAPLNAGERERRISGGGLSERQIALLDQYGYPYVLEEFRFHMTVTDRLAPEHREPVTAAARAWFAPFIDVPYTVDRLVLFHEPVPGAPFRRIGDFALQQEALAS